MSRRFGRRRWSAALCAVLFLAAGPRGARPASGQAWLSLEVTSETDLYFGQAVQGAGLVERLRTSPDIAKFKITGRLPGAGTGQRVVTLTFFPSPDLVGPAGGEVDFLMLGAYNSQADNPATATMFVGTTVDIPLQILEGYANEVGVYSAYAYVYGGVLVGAVPVGQYTGQILLEATRRPPDGGTGSVGCEVAWDPGVWYNEGDWVEYNGSAWRAL